MGKIISWFLKWLIKKGLMSYVYYTLAFIYFLSIVAAITAFFVALDYFIKLIRNLLSTVGTYSGGGDVIAKFYGLLNCSGFTQALNDATPALASAVVFLVARILIIEINKFYKKALGLLSNIMQSGV